MGPARKKYYAVRVGRRPGVYDTWAETEQQIKSFPRALHKSFPTKAEAEIFAGLKVLAHDDTPAASQIPQTVHPNTMPTIHNNIDSKSDTLPTRIHKPAAEIASGSAPNLTTEQFQILERILLGENIFFTGPAGTGKSVLLRAIIAAFNERKIGDAQRAGQRREEWAGNVLSGEADTGIKRVKGWNLAVTASTGMAAVNIGGCTLHSWAGVGLARQPVQKLYESVLRSENTLRRWREADALIVDELSMVPSSLLDTLSQLGSLLRGSPEPFGGIQVIASGDFYQLPPVPDRAEISAAPAVPTALFAFEARCWPRLFPQAQVISLKKVFRQSQTSFISLLTRLRQGVVEESDIQLIGSCQRPVEYADGIEPVSLMASKREAANLNQHRLCALRTSAQSFKSFDSPGVNSRGFMVTRPEAVALLDRQTNWESEVVIKVGALVMLLANMQDGKLVNGSTGIVSGFITIPEAQAQGIYIPERVFMANPEFDVSWPIVDFVPPPHLSRPNLSNAAGLDQPKNIIRAVIPKMNVTVNNAHGTAEATRHQIPLMLAWGMTIHKSQGQSIDRLRVDLSKIFERGQTYVALSRATNLDTLQVLGFKAEKVIAHPKVLEWSRAHEMGAAESEIYADLGFEIP